MKLAISNILYSCVFQEEGIFLLWYKQIKITIGNLQYSADQTMMNFTYNHATVLIKFQCKILLEKCT